MREGGDSRQGAASRLALDRLCTDVIPPSALPSIHPLTSGGFMASSVNTASERERERGTLYTSVLVNMCHPPFFPVFPLHPSLRLFPDLHSLASNSLHCQHFMCVFTPSFCFPLKEKHIYYTIFTLHVNAVEHMSCLLIKFPQLEVEKWKNFSHMRYFWKGKSMLEC